MQPSRFGGVATSGGLGLHSAACGPRPGGLESQEEHRMPRFQEAALSACASSEALRCARGWEWFAGLWVPRVVLRREELRRGLSQRAPASSAYPGGRFIC